MLFLTFLNFNFLSSAFQLLVISRLAFLFSFSLATCLSCLCSRAAAMYSWLVIIIDFKQPINNVTSSFEEWALFVESPKSMSTLMLCLGQSCPTLVKFFIPQWCLPPHPHPRLHILHCVFLVISQCHHILSSTFLSFGGRLVLWKVQVNWESGGCETGA